MVADWLQKAPPLVLELLLRLTLLPSQLAAYVGNENATALRLAEGSCALRGRPWQ